MEESWTWQGRGGKEGEEESAKERDEERRKPETFNGKVEIPNFRNCWW